MIRYNITIYHQMFPQSCKFCPARIKLYKVTFPISNSRITILSVSASYPSFIKSLAQSEDLIF